MARIRFKGRSRWLVLCVCAFLLAPAGATASPPAQPSLTTTTGLPLRRDAPRDTDGGWLQSALLLSLGVGAGGWWFWQQRRGRRSSGTGATGRERGGVVRLASQALTAQASVHAVQWNGEEYLVACTAQQVTLLGRRATSIREGGPHEQHAT